MTHSNWTWRLGWFALGGVILAVVLAVLLATLARYGGIDKGAGFMWVFRGVAIAAASCVIALVALLIGYFHRTGPRWPAGAALGLGVVFVAVLAIQIVPGMGAPPLHDITTNVDDPPQFRTLELREDNLIPFQNIEEWRSAHREGYPDIEPVIINKPPLEVLADARALVRERDWKIAAVDQRAGRLEATAYESYLRFEDDVMIKVTPIADGSTRVDMRSVSRVGLGDLGVNAKRIRTFLAELEGMA